MFPKFFVLTFAVMNLQLNDILDKVSTLYNRYGIRSVTMDDVARELGISKKTLYCFVTDKEDLVNKVMMYEFSKKRPLEQSNSHRNAIEDLFMVNNMINQIIKETNPSKEYDLQKYYPAIFNKIIKLRRERTMKMMMYNFKKGKKEGLYRDDLDEEILTKMYILRMGRMAHDEVVSVTEFTSPKFLYEMFVYHIRGIASQKGIEFLEKNISRILPKE